MNPKYLMQMGRGLLLALLVLCCSKKSLKEEEVWFCTGFTRGSWLFLDELGEQLKDEDRRAQGSSYMLFGDGEPLFVFYCLVSPAESSGGPKPAQRDAAMFGAHLVALLYQDMVSPSLEELSDCGFEFMQGWRRGDDWKLTKAWEHKVLGGRVVAAKKAFRDYLRRYSSELTADGWKLYLKERKQLRKMGWDEYVKEAKFSFKVGVRTFDQR